MLYSYLSNSRIFSSPPIEILYPLAVTPHSLVPWTQQLLPVTVHISYKWSPTVCSPLWLTSPTSFNDFKVHLCCRTSFIHVDK